MVATAAPAAGGGAVGGVGVTPHVLAVDDSSVDRAIIAAILRSSRFRGASPRRGLGCMHCCIMFQAVRARAFLFQSPSLIAFQFFNLWYAPVFVQ